MYESTWTQPRSPRFDTKQVICTVLGGVLAMGLIFLVGIHIGKDADPDFALAGEAMGIDAASSESDEAVAAMPVLDEDEAEPTDYEFFALLDSPAPRRELPEMELALNPVLEERKNKRKRAQKKARDARKKAAAEDRESGDSTEAAPSPPPAPAVVVTSRGSEPKPAPKAAPADERPDVLALAAAVAPTEPKVDSMPQPAPSAVTPEPVEAEPAPEPAKKVEPKKKKPEPKKKKRAKYTVQVSAFQDEAVADALAADFGAKGYEVDVKREAIPGRGAWFRVRVGKYGSREDAAKARSEIKSGAGYDGFVTSL